MTDLSAATVAAEVLAAIDACRQITPFTARDPHFDLDRAYSVACELRRLRTLRGEKPIGRKIGFTNRSAWEAYGISQPIWGDMYESTVLELPGSGRFRLPNLPEPRIEPEIVFKLASGLSPGLDELALIGSIEWVAQGFEIVHSLFPGWRFQAADAIADAGVHSALLVGPRRRVDSWEPQELSSALADFEITLCRNGMAIDRGNGAKVLGSPLIALHYVVDVLLHDPSNPPLRAGEIVTTGTLTRAFPVAAGERWTTMLQGIGLDGLTVDFI